MSKLTTSSAQYPRCDAVQAVGAKKAKRVDLVSLRLVREKSLLYGQRRIGCAEDGYQLLRPFLEDADREYVIIACLSTKNEPLKITVASVGSLDATIVHPREIFKTAVHCGASAILVAHNHPKCVLVAPVDHGTDVNAGVVVSHAYGVFGLHLAKQIL